MELWLTICLFITFRGKTLDKVGIKFEEERFYRLAGVPTLTIVELLSKEQGIELNAVEVAEKKDQKYHDIEDQVQEMSKVMRVVRENQGKFPDECWFW